MIDRKDLDVSVIRDRYDEKDPNKQRLNTVFATYKPTGVSVKVRHLS